MFEHKTVDFASAKRYIGRAFGHQGHAQMLAPSMVVDVHYHAPTPSTPQEVNITPGVPTYQSLYAKV